jgi:phosphatidylethanolamine-binding protein (PEBP) family uncharacterized protein
MREERRTKGERSIGGTLMKRNWRAPAPLFRVNHHQYWFVLCGIKKEKWRRHTTVEEFE